MIIIIMKEHLILDAYVQSAQNCSSISAKNRAYHT